MMPVTIYLNDHIPALRSALPDVVDKWLRRQVEEMHRLAREGAPVDTGNLQNSGASLVESSWTRVSGSVSFNAAYAAYVNFGTGQRGAASDVPERPPEVRYGSTVGMTARPFLSLAAVMASEELVRAVGQLEGYWGASAR